MGYLAGNETDTSVDSSPLHWSQSFVLKTPSLGLDGNCPKNADVHITTNTVLSFWSYTFVVHVVDNLMHVVVTSHGSPASSNPCLIVLFAKDEKQKYPVNQYWHLSIFTGFCAPQTNRRFDGCESTDVVTEDEFQKKRSEDAFQSVLIAIHVFREGEEW